MPTKNDMTGGMIYISSADGKTCKAFEGHKGATLTCTDRSGNEFYTTPFLWEQRLFYNCDVSLETQARILGFKNYNCYSRFIRRRKRRAERERRRRLKEGYFHA